jgi:hypothetical protein
MGQEYLGSRCVRNVPANATAAWAAIDTAPLAGPTNFQFAEQIGEV